jgi:hypothetical protein
LTGVVHEDSRWWRKCDIAGKAGTFSSMKSALYYVFIWILLLPSSFPDIRIMKKSLFISILIPLEHSYIMNKTV